MTTLTETELRADFEAWITAPPFERFVARFNDNAAWPDDYRDYYVCLSWCAWQAAALAQKARSKEYRSAPLDNLRALMNAQAEDDGLWFIARVIVPAMVPPCSRLNLLFKRL